MSLLPTVAVSGAAAATIGPWNSIGDASRQRTTRPMVTGTSVLGVVYDGGVLLAADTVLSYGSMAKAQRISRLTAFEGGTVVGGSGEFSDYQQVMRAVERLCLAETTTALMDSLYANNSGGSAITAETIWHYLRSVMYAKRNKFDPYWNDLVVAGIDGQGQSFLGRVDRIGTAVRDSFVATGFGSYLALPLMRERWRPDFTEGEARALLEDCLRVLFYRDCRASPLIQLAKCSLSPTAAAAAEVTRPLVQPPTVLISEPYEIDHQWDAPSFQRSSGDLDEDGGW